MENAVSGQEPSICTPSKWLPLAFSSIYEAAWDLQMHRNVSGHTPIHHMISDLFGDLIGQKSRFVRNYLPSQWGHHRGEFWKSTYFQRYRKNCIQLQHTRLMHLKDVVMTLLWRCYDVHFPQIVNENFVGTVFLHCWPALTNIYIFFLVINHVHLPK